MVTLRRCAVFALVLISLAGCGAGSTAVSPSPSPVPAVTATPSGSGPTLHDIVTNPDQYVGQTVTVEGVLEAEGQMPRVRFFLRDGNDRLEASPWAPLETVQAPQGEAPHTTMAYFVGLRLRLSGILEKGAEGPVLKVSVILELP